MNECLAVVVASFGTSVERLPSPTALSCPPPTTIQLSMRASLLPLALFPAAMPSAWRLSPSRRRSDWQCNTSAFTSTRG